MNVGARSVTQSNAAGDGSRPGHKRAPKESPLVCINVSGGVFYLHTSDLALHPNSLLASTSRLQEYFEKSLNSYFFDRNRHVFEYIATFYQTGKLAFPNELNKTLIKRELEFFGLKLAETENIAQTEEVVHVENSLKARVHLFLVDPTSSKSAAVWAAIDILFILISIICFILETEPGFQDAFEDKSHFMFPYLYWIEVTVAAYFSFDFLLRAISWPSPLTFVKNGQNIVDFLSLVPFYAQIFFSGFVFIESGKILRVFRIFRVIKLFKYFADMFLIIEFVCNAWQELVLVSMLTGILLILFGSIIYYAELEGPSQNKENPPFYSIMQGLWWSMVTITTVGYGDVYPETVMGRFFGSLLVIISMVVLTLPMTVVISKFNRAYETESRQSQKYVIVDSLLPRPSKSNSDWGAAPEASGKRDSSTSSITDIFTGRNLRSRTFG